MKNLFLVSFIVLFTTANYAQRKVEEQFKTSEGQQINFNFKFASNIKVIQWDRNEVNVTASVLLDNGEGNEAFSLKSEEYSGEMNIYSDYGDYFKQRNNIMLNCGDHKTEINYVVHVPRNCNLKIKSITGNVFSDNFSGKLVTDLVSGNVELKKYEGELSLKTVSGSLDVTMDKAEVDAKTLTGTIYSDLEIDRFNNNFKKSVSSRVQGIVSNGKQRTKLETISGNIYMRKE
ncbi:DUF4097 family beta strand repeat-containing protein [Zunongwangia pacifica]|uniref:DUF4097 domain-containing protein n=1 Tax=Zunongwangia pacifica TaxID=2911062 RepID=A0A9X2CN93_9FLAO|nr:hypothetical protein [Zunongwangia pacifica]MCL6220335.1 hypothetical protein [Zunongwangia pacifica]